MRSPPEVAAAWDEVYWLFATQLIAEEARLYTLGGSAPDQPWRKYRVIDRFDETDEIFSLELQPVEGPLPPHTTGQYVSIAVDLSPTERQPPRQYTISGGSRRGGRLPGDDQAGPRRGRRPRTGGSPTGWATTPRSGPCWMCPSRPGGT